MAQENYYDSPYSEIAGGLLARGKDKDDAGKAIILGIIQQFASNAKAGLKKSVIDGSKDVATKWTGILKGLEEDFDNASEDRKAAQEYKDRPDIFLTKRAIENIDLVTPGKNFTYATRFAKNVTEQQRKDLAQSLDEEKAELKKLWDLKLLDPKISINNRVDFLAPAFNAGLAADKAVINDPTKRNLVAAFYNRVFKTERNEDGELVTTNGKLLKLKNDADVAENVYLEQQKDLDAAELKLESHFEGLIGQDVDKTNFDEAVPTIFTVTGKEKRDQVKLNNDVMYIIKNNKRVFNSKYWDIPKDVTLASPNGTTGTKTVDIKKEKFKNIVIKNEDGEISNYSEQEFLQDVATRQIQIRKAIEAQGGSTPPDIGVLSFEGALDAFAKEGRFMEVSALNDKSLWRLAVNNKNFNLDNPNSIIFIKPGTNVLNSQKVNTSDLIQAGEDNSSIEEEANLDGDKGDSSVYSHLALETMMGNKNFIQASVETQNKEVAELIKVYPEKEEEITALYDTFKNNLTPTNNFITEDNYDSLGIKSFVKLTDRPIINKLIEVESSGKPNEISKHGAKGYMQLKDSTADNPGVEGVPPVVRDKAGNISHEENVIFGTNYYDGLVRRYDGDMVTAAMAYNLGFGAIDTWISKGRNFGELRKETQDYVKKVFGQDIYDKVKSGEYGTSEIQILKTTENNTPVKSLLSSDKEITPIDAFARAESDIEKEALKKLAKDFKSIPGKLKERGKNIERKRAADILSGEKSVFSSTSYSKWKTENDIVDKYNTPRKEKEKNVENYLEFLNQ